MAELQEYHVVLHVIVQAEDEDHAREQAADMGGDYMTVVEPDQCDAVLRSYRGKGGFHA